MLFNSLAFLLFFPLVCLGYFLFPHRIRWAWLLAASCFFYMCFIPKYILILGLTIAIDYSAGLLMEAYPMHKKRFLVASIILNMMLLIVYKYLPFLSENVVELARLLHWNYPLHALEFILPLGLSFHTFQSVSYTVEVYRGNQKTERHLGIFALYVLFFPQLVAGPIERPQNMLHQFKEKHFFSWPRIATGLQRMLLGFFKKLVIADLAATFVNQVYQYPSDYPGISIAIALVLFAFQIYGDFSGYSDIALGSAQVLGFTLMENFKQPYLSRSISEFWKRWHISLSSWFRDYVYIPLGGNRRGNGRTYFNVFLTFFLSGIWHGANWTFFIWGALNGLYIIIASITQRIHAPFAANLPKVFGSKILATWQTLATFSLICFGWIFFRASNVGQSWVIIRQLFSGWSQTLSTWPSPAFIAKNIFLGRPADTFYVCVLSILALLIFEAGQRLGYFVSFKDRPHTTSFHIGRWLVLSTALLLILVFSQTQSQTFIYFQF